MNRSTEGDELLSALVNTTAPSGSADAAALAAQRFITLFRRKLYYLQIFVVLGYGLMAVLCVALACYLRYNRNVALRGDASAARKILLPAFEPLIWILAVFTGTFTLTVSLTLSLGVFSKQVTPLASEAFYCGRMVVLLMVIVYMLQKCVTVPALLRTIGISLVGGTYTMLVELVLAQYSDGSPGYDKLHHIAMVIAKSLLLVFFTYVFISPPGRASKRSLREYIAFIYVYYAGVYAYTFLLNQQYFDAGFIMVYVTTMWAALAPLFIWRVLSADTQHWRGMGQRAVSLQTLFRRKHNLNERVSSQGLHVLIEMHRKLIIDFAILELKHKIGVGSTAIVFHGLLHSKTPVAVKVYTPTECHEETVAAFSQEAALCGALHHPNIVKFYGMCVCPPTICLVSELCQGSLDDVTLATAQSRQHPNRQQALLNMAYMIDAARAVAYIHSFSPAFVHRDIKPSNFLVDAENTVKLTDFGESRSLPKAHMMTPPVGVSTASGSVKRLFSGVSRLQHRNRQSSVTNNDPLQPAPAAQLTVKGTVDYMAPEIIQGRAGVAQYGEAADVYSLAITLWDIWNPGKEKFPTIRNNHLHVFESVVQGKRPALDAAIHPSIRQVIESAWHPDPRLRPSAQTLVAILEAVQEELFAVFAMDLADELEYDPLYNKYGELVAQTFSAKQASDRMEELCFVNTEAEALRLGNALMDAGLLHHAKHERPYELGHGLYFFDDDNINLCRPLLAAGEGQDDDVDADERIDHVVPLPQSSVPVMARLSSKRPKSVTSYRRKATSSAARSATSHTANARSENATTVYDNGICPCRKLGQRVEQPKHSSGGASKRLGFRRRDRHKAASEENILTAKLLGAEQRDAAELSITRSATATSDFDDFDAVSTNFEQHVV
jgi:serine/threonine protein kinase